MSLRTWLRLIALVVVAATLSGCAGPNVLAGTPGARGVAGFWAGLWHGLICVITFVISLFKHDVQVYEVHNNGSWYNFGFILGAMVSLGGGGRSSRRN